MLAKVIDLDDVPADQPPLSRTDNVMVTQVSDEAVRLSGIDKVQYIKFESVVAPDAAATMLSTNLTKAVRALTHLLDNALKFTTDGSVKLTVNVDMEKMQAVYTVEDTGSGIEAAEQEHIFEPYVKLNQFFDGDGIGLTVARNIARRLGGDLTLDAEYAGPGARFVLALPI
jgi:signal transduction histidine kinase